MKIKTLHTVDTEYSADSVEWCSHLNYLQYFACGTYQLEETNSESTLMSSAPCRRKGRIILFHYDTNEDILKEVDRIETSAILDMKWLDNHNIPILATANALGQIDVYQLENEKFNLLSKCNINSENPNLLSLSLDWIKTDNNDMPKILTSDSKGEISILQYRPDSSELKKIISWSAHNFEAWTCASDKWNSNLCYTGGDDTVMHAFDIRAADSAMKIFTNKQHIAGVTTLLSHPTKENILLSGSYDERVRIFDTKYLKNPLFEFNVNGGIWRIRSDPNNLNFILCACMYHNFQILSITDNCNDINLVAEYNEHESICYGSDWCKKINNKHNNLIMATCSFYDHKLCVSSVAP